MVAAEHLFQTSIFREPEERNAKRIRNPTLRFPLRIFRTLSVLFFCFLSLISFRRRHLRLETRERLKNVFRVSRVVAAERFFFSAPLGNEQAARSKWENVTMTYFARETIYRSVKITLLTLVSQLHSCKSTKYNAKKSDLTYKYRQIKFQVNNKLSTAQRARQSKVFR